MDTFQGYELRFRQALNGPRGIGFPARSLVANPTSVAVYGRSCCNLELSSYGVRVRQRQWFPSLPFSVNARLELLNSQKQSRRSKGLPNGVIEVETNDPLTSRRQLCIFSAISSSAVSSDGASNCTREEHFKQLEEFYNENQYLFVDEKWGALDQDDGGTSWPECYGVFFAAGQVERVSTVLVVGGSPAFAQQLSLACSPTSLIVSHLSLSVLASIKEMNDNTVCLYGDLEELPDSYGPYHSVFLNSIMAISHSPAHLLRDVASLCEPGARIVISHSQGREQIGVCMDKNPQLILRNLPDLARLRAMSSTLPLKLVEFQDEPSFYLAALEVTATSNSDALQETSGEMTTSPMRNAATNENFPLQVRGHIVRGFGRGAKEVGIPTANIDPVEVPSEILELPKGVYFGWAQVMANGVDNGVHKMVMNIGKRPTFGEDEQVAVEVHIMHYYESDFYGAELSIIILGFIRNEMQFNSLNDLMERINTDISIAEKCLDEDVKFLYASDAFFTRFN